jgi:hypothetical protein
MSGASVRFWRLGLVVLVVACLAAASSLTKDDVIRMAKAGRSDGAILGAIQDAHATFDLTADDIAELRNAGVSERMIDVMIATGPAQPGEELGDTEQAQTEPGSSYESSEEQTAEPDYYQGAPVIAYPVYPLYYPAYFPVYDPFFPFFDGFFFSFEFVHVSRLVTVFPCDRTVLVLRNSVVLNRSSFSASRPIVFGTPRTLTRAGSGSLLNGRLTGGNAGRPTAGRDPVSPTFPRVPSRFGAQRPNPGLPASRRMGVPRWTVPPSRGAHLQAPPRTQSVPRFPSPQRFAAPSFRAPRPMPVSHGSPRMGGMRSFSAPRVGGAGRSHSGRH